MRRERERERAVESLKCCDRKEELFFLSQAASLTDFETYFVVEVLVNNREHEGCSPSVSK